MGRKEIPGRPLIYGTTRRFLEVFGLETLKDLPTPKEIEELGKAPLETADSEPTEDHETESQPPAADGSVDIPRNDDTPAADQVPENVDIPDDNPAVYRPPDDTDENEPKNT